MTLRFKIKEKEETEKEKIDSEIEVQYDKEDCVETEETQRK